MAMLFLIFIRESLFSFFIGVINILFVMKNYIHFIIIRCPLLKIIRAAIVRIKKYNISYWKPVGRLGEPQAKEDRSDRYV